MCKLLILLFLWVFPIGSAFVKNETVKNETELVHKTSDSHELFKELQLEDKVPYQAFEQAYKGYESVNKKKNILTLIDFTKASTEERMYVIDMDQRKLLYVTHVSHGKNSGGNFATSFSNKNGSNQSSLGFFLTENTYQGKNGYSLVLNGLEKGINDKAKERAIVVHGAAYSNPSFIKSAGRLGRSLGCPALPQAVSKEIINTIKGGSLMFIYANDKNYVSQSKIISSGVNYANNM